jgi:hypothetical protein
MAIGRISGSVLKSNLTRNGTDLAFETNLLYLDVTNSRIGIGTSEPTTALHVNGTITATAISGLTSLAVDTVTIADNTITTNASNADLVLDPSGTGRVVIKNELVTNSISSDDSTAIQINDGVNISGVLSANTIDTNVISSSDSSAIQVQDSINLGSNTITANTGNFTNFTLSDTLTIGSQIIYAQGNNGFSVNEDFDPSNSSTQTAYHYTTGAGRETLAFTLARTGQFTDGFGIYGTAANNTFVTFGEQSNTSFEWRRGVGIRPLDLDGGTLMMRLSSTGDLTINNDIIVQGSVFADSIQSTGSNANIVLSPQGSGKVILSGLSFPSSDGSNGQVLQTDGSGNLTFAESSGGGGGNNTAVKTFEYNKLGTNSTVIDEFDVSEYRAAVYHIGIEDITNTLVGHTTVNVVHDSTTAYMSQYDSNEDSANLASYTVAISGTKVQLSASANAQSSHVNLRIYRVALGDHHETVANTNSKIIVSTTAIDSTATTIDQFTKTDIQGAKYYILIKNATNSDYQISEMNLVHDGTTVYFNDYGKTSTNANQYLATFSADISGATVSLKAIAGGGTEATATMYRIDLGSKTKLGEYDSVFYGKAGNVDSAVQTIDSFDVYEKRTAKYFINIGNAGDTEYQNSEITLTNNGTDAFITETKVRSGTTDLATFSADVSSGRVRLRMSGTSADNVIYLARMSMVSPAIYRASADTANNLYVSANNFNLTDTLVNFSGATGALTLPSGTSGQQPTGTAGMLRYNSSLSRYEKWDGSAFVDILATTAAAADTSNASVPTPTTGIGTTATTIDSFTTGSYDSAFYYAVTRDEINGETATERYTLVHNDSTAYVSSSNGVQSGTNDQIAIDADISAGTVRLRATGTSVVNSVSLYRIGLGDSTTAGSAGNTATVLNTDVDSAVEDLDTWSATSYRGAKYFISINAANGELGNVEAAVVHNGSDAFITIYNEIYTGNNSLITLSADISGGNVRLRGSGNTPNLNVKMYRILLGDAETTATGDNTKTVGASTVSSSATAIDTFSTSSYTGAQYVVVAYNSSEPGTPASISEVMVVEDGSDAYVSSGPIVSTKGTDQLSFTAALSGTTVTLSAASTSGGSTTVNAFRVALLRTEAGAATSNTVLISPAQTITGAKTFTAPIALTVGSDPSTVADKAHIYAKDEASSAEVFVRDEAGNVTKISPHNAQGEWEYYSRNTRTGKTVRINMEEMIRDIERLTGKTYIKDQ